LSATATAYSIRALIFPSSSERKVFIAISVFSSQASVDSWLAPVMA
jgi:hypothetical protein